MARINYFKAAILAGLLQNANASQNKQEPLGVKDSHAGHNPLNDDIAEFIGEVMDRWKIAGMSVAVVDGDDVYSQVNTPFHLMDSFQL